MRIRKLAWLMCLGKWLGGSIQGWKWVARVVFFFVIVSSGHHPNRH
jgi:hypothetical protein